MTGEVCIYSPCRHSGPPIMPCCCCCWGGGGGGGCGWTVSSPSSEEEEDEEDMEEDEEEQGGGEVGGHWELWLGTADWELWVGRTKYNICKCFFKCKVFIIGNRESSRTRTIKPYSSQSFGYPTFVPFNDIFKWLLIKSRTFPLLNFLFTCGAERIVRATEIPSLTWIVAYNNLQSDLTSHGLESLLLPYSAISVHY